MRTMGAEEGTFCHNGHFYDPSQSRFCVRCAAAEYPQVGPLPEAPSLTKSQLIKRLNDFSMGWGARYMTKRQKKLSASMKDAIDLLRFGDAQYVGTNSWRVVDFETGEYLGEVLWVTLKALGDRDIVQMVKPYFRTLTPASDAA